jgi:hypothetical protein
MPYMNPSDEAVRIGARALWLPPIGHRERGVGGPRLGGRTHGLMDRCIGQTVHRLAIRAGARAST